MISEPESAPPVLTIDEPEAEPANVEREFTVEARAQWRMVLRRFMRHRLALGSLIALVLIVLASLFGGRLWRYDHDDKFGSDDRITIDDLNKGPSWDHPFGTDAIGKDGLALVLRGAQKSVQIMLLVAVLSTAIGLSFGAVAGFFGGWIDNLMMRFIDLLLTLPALAIVAVLSVRVRQGGSWYLVAVILALTLWTTLARVVRAEVLSLREKEFVEAARSMGAGSTRIIVRHLLPNIIGTVIVAATLTMALAILAESALSFIGLGIRPPDTSLGLLVSENATAARTRPWLFYFPGLVIIVIVMCVNFIGDGLRDAFDPKQNRVRA